MLLVSQGFELFKSTIQMGSFGVALELVGSLSCIYCCLRLYSSLFGEEGGGVLLVGVVMMVVMLLLVVMAEFG